MLLALCSEGMASFSVCMIEKFVRMERKTVNFKQSFISPRNELTLANPKGCIFGGEPELGTNCVYIYTARSFLFGTSGKSFFFFFGPLICLDVSLNYFCALGKRGFWFFFPKRVNILKCCSCVLKYLLYYCVLFLLNPLASWKMWTWCCTGDAAPVPEAVRALCALGADRAG